MGYSGWTDELLAERNAEAGSNLNHVEADIVCAIRDGHDELDLIVEATGYTRGQVQHALGVLSAQGMI